MTDKFGNVVKNYSGPTLVKNVNGVENTVDYGNIVSLYEYDILGNLLKEHPPKADNNPIEKTEYRYNTRGQMIWKKNPDGGEFEYQYRDDGQLDNVYSFKMDEDTRIENRRIGYNYDALGRVNYIACGYYGPGPWGRSETVLDQARYYYDDIKEFKDRPVFQSIPDHYLATLTNLKGRLVATESIHYFRRVQNPNERYFVGEVFSYDDEGRIKSKYTAMTGSPLFQEIHYQYDIHGKVLSEAFYYGGDNFVKRYMYDQLGRLWWVEQGKLQQDGSYKYDQKLVEYTYDPLGRVDTTKLSATGDHNTTIEYDILDRITNRVTRKGIENPVTRFGEAITGYSKSGNIREVNYNYEAVSGSYKESYQYDSLYRLVGANITPSSASAYQNSYGYDAGGRFLNKTEDGKQISDYQYYDGTNRLKNTSQNSNESEQYIYDDQGNLVVDFKKNMVIQYDWRDMPIVFRFYNDLSSAGLTKDSNTGTYSGDDLYAYMEEKVSSDGIDLLSTVYMLYNVDGKRVCKMDAKEN